MISGGSANIYYNCADEKSCWGDPEGFLKDLAISKFIHVTDQYIGSKKNGRYPFSAADTSHPIGPTGPLDTTDIENLVHAAALQFGPHIFHVFLHQGVDVCPDPGVCYSPDNESTFVFCAYHSSASFAEFDVEIPYTVEPFQNVTGCQVAGPWPHDQLTDSTDSALSHELFETITDPFSDSTAWVAGNSQPEEGNEIADICHGVGNENREEIVPSFTLAKGHVYELQLEYSNAKHGCVAAP